MHATIKRNSLTLFAKPKRRVICKQKQKTKVFQNNAALFGQLYVAMQTRESDLMEFFAHEMQSFPPSLSDYGKLHLPGTKSELLKCIEDQQSKACPRQHYFGWCSNSAFIANYWD